jgi:hypothetical protein
MSINFSEEDTNRLNQLFEELYMSEPWSERATTAIKNTLKNIGQVVSTLNDTLSDHYSSLFKISLVFLSLLFAKFGFNAFLYYKQVYKQKHAKSLNDLYTSSDLLKLTPDMTIVARCINDKGQLKSTMNIDSDDDGLQKVWEIIGDTVASDEKIIEPIFISETNHNVSFIKIPIPTDKTKNLIQDMQSLLKEHHFIPTKSPKRGPFKSFPFVRIDSSEIDGKLHPELVISVII